MITVGYMREGQEVREGSGKLDDRPVGDF